MSSRPIDILLVEDNPGDVRLLVEAFKEGKLANRLHMVGDGEEALAYLRRQGDRYAAAARPDLILLDLNLPKKGGREVLAEIKADEALRAIPVIVLTTSQAEEDIVKAYNLHANCYIAKSSNFEEFLNAVRAIESFWLQVVKLPSDAGQRDGH